MYGFQAIYAVLDGNNNPVYVGRTGQGISDRLRHHHCAKTKMGEWCRENQDVLRAIELEVVEQRLAGFHERTWITKFRDEGHELLNVWPRKRGMEKALLELDRVEYDRRVKDIENEKAQRAAKRAAAAAQQGASA